MRNLKTLLKTALVISPIVILASCGKPEAKFENLETGEKVFIIKDPETGFAMDSIANKPVKFYVDLTTKDTIYGETGVVVNNSIIKTSEGTYILDESKFDDNVEVDINSGDVKIKVDGDETKIKTDEKKIKIDGDEKKVKYNN
ncbi:hypothetical protein [Pedobacter cryophilus]|uniref:Lipoprotein n=1 Tax=Pedobacter cryophilus TaxID=2571271 RepID=A0A4U1C1S0_9SPHI|nr:hypothetical protein [Pedobacter cryophilus]TKB98934.1 hypothetical protein FA046_07410 [Pedobacter cryophilus]